MRASRVKWLLSAIEADRLLQNYFSENPGFHARIARLDYRYRIEFALSAWRRFSVSWPALAFLNKRAHDTK